MRLAALPAHHGRTLAKAMAGRLPKEADWFYRQLDGFRLERVRACRMLWKQAKKVPAMKLIRTVPGLGPRTAPTVAAWISDPDRFGSESRLALCSGLGLKNDWTAGRQVKRARASKRPQVRTFSGADRPGGNRELKRALFLPARGALRGSSALRARYDARIAAGWEDRKAIRDVARTILFVVCAVWRPGKEYDDTRAGTGGNDDARRSRGHLAVRT